jgi:predicted PurR-regulated permease PerM
VGFPPPTERQARVIWLALTGLAVAVLAGLLGGLVWALGLAVRYLAPVLWPIAVAGVAAYLLDPLVDFLEGRGQKRARAIILVFALALVLVSAFFSSVVPQVVTETRQLALRIPDYAARTERRLELWANNPPPLVRKLLERLGTVGPGLKPAAAAQNSATETNAAPVAIVTTNAPAAFGGQLDPQTIQTATDWLAKFLPQAGQWLFGQVGRVASWFAVLAGIALVPVYAFYFLLEKKGISSRWTNYLPVADSRFKTELVFVLGAINNYLISFFRGQLLVAACDGALYGVGFLLIGIPYAALIAVAAVFLTMIPFLGAIIICITALAIAIVQFGDWTHPLLVLAVFGCVQSLEAMFISPRIMGGRVGLHPVTIIIAVMVGTTLLGGLLGGILAIPLTAALRVVMFRYVWKKRTGNADMAGPIAASAETEQLRKG